MILADTSVLSQAFRRTTRTSPVPPVVQVLRRLIEKDLPLGIPGIVLQELLSGVRTEAEFERLRDLMEGFHLVLAERAHHLHAARISNTCRRAGVTVSAVDCLIAAMAIGMEARLLTSDEVFKRIASHCPLLLFEYAP